MRGDFARLTFNPTKHYTGVLHQQGRVWLEADWNEDVFDRQNLLWQETFDIIGACGVPEPGTAFQISPNLDPASQPFDFLISGGPGEQGRYYVDGILCQLEQNTTYLSQPDFPHAPDIQMPTDGGDLHALVYLEVWQRLITYLEDDALREIALGGPDTATRLKTIAQVKVRAVSSDDAPNLTCANADQFLPQPGQGTLTTLQPKDSQPDDLCKLPDPSSYTGRENHLYRVEIHNGGDVLGSNTGFAFTEPLAQDTASDTLTLILQNVLSPEQLDALNRSGVVSLMDSDGQTEIATVTGASTDSSSSTTQLTLSKALSARFTVAKNATVTGGVARFKWSQDNAAFAVRVTAVSEDRLTLTLSSLGRDTATALRQLNLVEISDDVSELGPTRGHLTYLAGDPDPDQFTVTIADPLPDNFQVTRHLILRRWDGLGSANATFNAATTPDMNFGNGIHIQFGSQDLRPGDYWQFAARSADGSVEALTNAPPFGIIRHTCPLAVVKWDFQVLFNEETIVNAARDIDFSPDQISRLEQKLHDSRKTLWNASEVEVLIGSVGATQGQLSALREKLASLSKETAPRLTFTVLEDCRPPFHPLTKPCCDCTVTVAPGDSLSAAFDKISGVGGTVCLLPGIHELTDTVLVSAKNGLTIRGAGAATIISAPTASIALNFVGCVNLTLRDLTINTLQPDSLQSRPDKVAAGQSTAPGTAKSTPQAVPESGAGPVNGVVTFTDCQAVRVTGCIVACTALPNETRACISFLGISPSREIRNLQQQLQTQSPPSSGKMPEDQQTSSPSTEAKTEEKKKGGRRRQQAQASSSTTEEKSTTSSPGDAVSAPASLSLVTSARESGGFDLDFTLRDCRLYADTGQFGLFVTTSIGVSVEDNWFFPLANLDPTGLETVLIGVDQNQRANTALTFAQCAVLTVTNSLILGFNSVLSASAEYLLLHDNFAVECGDGFTISPSFASLRITDNVLSMDTGPAVTIASGSGETLLSGNDLLRQSPPPEFAQNPLQVVSINTDTVTLSDNNFRNFATPDSSVIVTANRITYTSNRSLCSNLPTIANVILLGPTQNEQVTGSITAVSNTCLEPPPAEATQFVASLQEFQTQQATLTSQFITTTDPAQRQQLLQQLISIGNDGQQLALRLDGIVSSAGGPLSLFASASFVVTGMNLLSNRLLRVGLGSDQGSVEGVF